MPTFGTCRLTGVSGPLVKAHIIPEALTKPSIPGESFIQAGRGERPIRRWTSWYDANLVTADGEKILAAYDAWGIEELRRLNLVWSSNGSQEIAYLEDWSAIGNSGHGIRIFEYEEGDKLRLFFLSILWRAAASKLHEFREIRIPQRQLNQLARMLISGNAKPHFVFPVSLIQLTQKGPRQNFTPLAGKKQVGPNTSNHIRIFRFYVDGLAFHFHRDVDVASWRGMGDACVQQSKQLGVITVPYLISLQNEIFEREAHTAEQEWPVVLAKLSKPKIRANKVM